LLVSIFNYLNNGPFLKIEAAAPQIALGANYKESGKEIHGIKPRKIYVSAIHGDDGVFFQGKDIQDIDIVYFAGSQVDNDGMAPRRSRKVCILMAAWSCENAPKGRGIGTGRWSLSRKHRENNPDRSTVLRSDRAFW
jgi:hypothetical protein